MAVQGIQLQAGQKWLTNCGSLLSIEATPGGAPCGHVVASYFGNKFIFTQDGRRADMTSVSGPHPDDLKEFVSGPMGNGWIKHDGKKCPLKEGTRVEVIFSNGSKYAGRALTNDYCMSEKYWSSKSEPGLIIHSYRVIEQIEDAIVPVTAAPGADTREYTGGKVNYYELEIKNPTRDGRQPYTAECNDIIEAANMTFAEGEAFKAIWRGAAARMNLAKRGYTDGLYDAQKVAFYGNRMVIQHKEKKS